MKRLSVCMHVLAWMFCVAALAACGGKDAALRGTYIPQVPDYEDDICWFTRMGDATGKGADVFYLVSTWEADWTAEDGRLCHYADVYNPLHPGASIHGVDKEVGGYQVEVLDGSVQWDMYFNSQGEFGREVQDRG